MERPAWMTAAHTSIQAQATGPGGRAESRAIPVFWVSGPSGAGKSVLVLQLMRDLLANGEAARAQYLGEFTHILPRTLLYCARLSDRTLIVVDDLFAPECRETSLWREIAAIAFTRRHEWHLIPWILSCGTREQLSAFRSELSRHAEFYIVELKVAPLSPQEQHAYHEWYKNRTSSELPFIRESIFVASTWRYELNRKMGFTVDAFAQRFDTRLEELGLQEVARTALSLNRLGLKAPEALFSGLNDALDTLVGEEIYRLANPGTGYRHGRFFHPQIAELIYQWAAPETDLYRRGSDLARGFAAMLCGSDDGASGDAFLAWIGSTKAEKRLPKELLQVTATAMWEVLRDAGINDGAARRLLRWHSFATRLRVDTSRIGAAALIRCWLSKTDATSTMWPILFQLAWRDAGNEERRRLFQQGLLWIEEFFENNSWSFVWQQLWSQGADQDRLVVAAQLWLDANLSHVAWAHVWQPLLESSVPAADLIRVALNAVPLQPDTPADLPVWQKIEKLGPNSNELLGAILQKLARLRSPHKMRQGVAFVVSRVTGVPMSELFSHSSSTAMDEAGWPYLWQELVSHSGGERMLAIGRDWLAGREDRPEWSHVWRRLMESGFEPERMPAVGRDWLAGREDRPEWAFVVRCLQRFAAR